MSYDPNTNTAAQTYSCTECSRFGINSCSLHSPLRFQQPQPQVIVTPPPASPWPLSVEQAAANAYRAMERYWLDLIERQAVPSQGDSA